MFKNADFSKLGGLNFYQTTLDYLQTAYTQVLDALADSYGDLVIVSGLTVTGSNVTDGWIVYNKQLYPVAGGALQLFLYEDTSTQGEQFADGGFKNVYTTKRFLFTNTNTGIAWSDVKRLPFATSSLLDAFTTVQTLFSKLVFDEPVILSGCATSALDTGTSKVTIATGLVYIGGKMISTSAYPNNTYPVYLNSAGAWSSAQPSGAFIKFDHETSQRYGDVVRRNTSHTGQVFTHTNVDELQYFDANGVGKWRWLGFKISELLQSRVPVGYDKRTSNPGGAEAKAWDAANRTIGNAVGENTHKIVVNELPKHSFYTVTNNDGTDSNFLDSAAESIAKRGTLQNAGDYTLTAGAGTPNIGKTNIVGNDDEHENRQSSRIVLQIERM